MFLVLHANVFSANRIEENAFIVTIQMYKCISNSDVGEERGVRCTVSAALYTYDEQYFFF